MGYKVLVVEDDEDISRFIIKCLEKEGYMATAAFSGTEARLQLSLHSYDLVLLDLMLPGISGEAIIQEIRKTSNIPIIVISAKVVIEAKVMALKLGADDYITKPFEKEELLARMEAVLRRSEHNIVPSCKTLQFKNLILMPERRMAMIQQEELNLTASEFDILMLLVKHKDRAFTKDQIYQEVWKEGYYGEDNTISVHISNIRKKIKQWDEDSYIKTVWGIGFKMDTGTNL